MGYCRSKSMVVVIIVVAQYFLIGFIRSDSDDKTQGPFSLSGAECKATTCID